MTFRPILYVLSLILIVASVSACGPRKPLYYDPYSHELRGGLDSVD